MLQTQSRLQRNGHWIIFGIVITLGLSMALYLYGLDKYSLIYFGDSASHMVGARKLIDWSENPGLAQLGTVWLPLPHILLLPFTLVDPLFTTGFAGVAVSLPCMAITAALLHKMIRTHLISGLSYIAFAGALLYTSNANILYLGITPMTEAPFMSFFVTSAYFYQKWRKNLEDLPSIGLCSFFVVLASLCRYEGWILPLFLAPFATLMLIGSKVDDKRKALGILLALASLSGIIVWVLYNAIQYGDPLEFANAQYYSASSQALSRDIRETLFLQPANVMGVYGTTAFIVYGPILLAAALTGYILQRKSKGGNEKQILYVFLILPPIFTIITLLIGVGEMGFWFNSRFVILLAPLIAMLAAVAFLQNLPCKIKKNRSLTALVIAALFMFQISMTAFGPVPVFLDARAGFYYEASPFASQAGEVLGSMYDNGTIMTLTGSSQEHKIMVTSGIPLRQFDEVLESSNLKQSVVEPWLYDSWIVISKEPDADAVSAAKYWEERRNVLDEHYKKVYENAYYEILALR